MQAWRRLRHWSMLSSITLCSTPTHASIRFCLKSSTSWQTWCPIFWNKCTEVRAVQWVEILNFMHVFYITALLDWEQRMMHRMSGQTQLAENNNQQNLSKMIIWYCSIYNQTASDAWRYYNPVYKLMTDKLQLMLINVLIDQFLGSTP